MITFIKNRIGVKVTIIVNFVTLIVVAIGFSVLINNQGRRLQDELLNRGKILTNIGAKMVGEVLSEAIDNDVFEVGDVFDKNYEPIGSFTPPKYHTKYDVYLDKAILKLQDEFLVDKEVEYAVTVDSNGYLPTHNTRYQNPLTGDPQKDMIGNRTKRIFNDAVGIAAARNKEKGFQQVYTMDTGRIVWDISSPIFVKGKHWGAFRVGYSIYKITQAKRHLAIVLTIIMAAILITSGLCILVTVTKMLAPLKRLTQTAENLSRAQNIDQKIIVSRTDEIGRLEQVLEKIRLSLLVILRRSQKG